MKKVLFVMLMLWAFLGKGQEARLVLPVGHTGVINSAKYSPDGKYVITASNDGTARIWDSNTAKELMVIIGHSAGINYAEFSADGKKIVTASSDSTARIWDFPNCNQIHVLYEKDEISLARFSPDCRQILTSTKIQSVNFGTEDRGIYCKTWDVKTGKLVFDLAKKLPKEEIIYRFANFSHDGKFIMFNSIDNSLSVWKNEDDKETIGEEVKFYPQGKLYIFDAQTGTNLKQYNCDDCIAMFSPDNKFFLYTSQDSILFCDLKTFEIKHTITDVIGPINFSPSGKKLIACSKDKKTLVWESQNGKVLFELEDESKNTSHVRFSKDELKIVKSSEGFSEKYQIKGIDTFIVFGISVEYGVWDGGNGKLINLIDEDFISGEFEISPVSNVLLCSHELYFYEFDKLKNPRRNSYVNPSVEYNHADFSNKGDYIYLSSIIDRKYDSVDDFKSYQSILFQKFESKTCKIYNSVIENLHPYDTIGEIIHVNFEIEKLVTLRDRKLFIWDLNNQSKIFESKDTNEIILVHLLNNENIGIQSAIKGLVLDSLDVKFVNLKTGNLWFNKKFETQHSIMEFPIEFSLGGNLASVTPLKKSEVSFYQDTAFIYQLNPFKLLQQIKIESYENQALNVLFSNDESFLIKRFSNGSFELLDTKNGKLINKFEGHLKPITDIFENKDRKIIISASQYDKTIRIWDKLNCKSKFIINDFLDKKMVISPDGNILVKRNRDNTYSVWNLITGKKITDLEESSYIKHELSWECGKILWCYIDLNCPVHDIKFSPDSKYIIRIAEDKKYILWDAATGRQLYTRLQLKNGDWLVYDEHYRYDGTQGARDYLYFVCGLEVVDLAQVKDALYVPNLVQRIMNGENLDHLPKLKDLEICGVTPEVEPLDNKKDGGHYYQIKARKGGVGKVEIYINGMLRQTLDSKTLAQKEGIYELKIEEKLIQQYQIADKETEIKVVARTADNKISSRGSVAKATVKESVIRKPQMHAIMVGIDDYKGTGFDLNYAAKDAIDLQTALKISTQKLFNVDDTNRVHFYNLTLDRSGNINGLTPDRNNILKTLEKIEKESNPEDVFILFFAGHGEINPDKQLILLTAEASKDQAPNYSGILMKELLEKLARIPAGKRILLLDACHSGAAINELNIKDIAGVRDGEDAEKQSQRLKELENLASKSGLAIITASSTDQKALELPQYEHGLMTYALLTTMLNDPEVLDKDNNLQLEDWLRQTEKNVSKLIENQSAQRFVPVNFSVGKVDDAVRKSIILQEIPTVVVANVLNKETDDDDLDLKTQLVKKLNEISTRGGTDKIIIAEKDGPNAISVNLSYELSEGKIKSKITLKKEKKVFKQLNFEGNAADLNKFVEELSKEITKNLK